MVFQRSVWDFYLIISICWCFLSTKFVFVCLIWCRIILEKTSLLITFLRLSLEIDLHSKVVVGRSWTVGQTIISSYITLITVDLESLVSNFLKEFVWSYDRQRIFSNLLGLKLIFSFIVLFQCEICTVDFIALFCTFFFLFLSFNQFEIHMITLKRLEYCCY